MRNTKYATITPAQKKKKKILSPYFINLSNDNAAYCSIKPLLVNSCCKTFMLDVSGVCGLCRYSIIFSPKQINKRGTTLKILLKQSKISV